ncbi:MAG: hypothetical protein MUC56_08320, partial [Thermoanaerobaculales bacterium]|nr:hypothetical protein [Thermoanaerobaculales bacterium]
MVGYSWQVLGGGVLDLVVFDDGSGPALFAAGTFGTDYGGNVGNRVAKWDGTHWMALIGPAGEGLDGRANALSIFDDGTGAALYVGGFFETAGGVTSNRIARWDGTVWSSLIGPSANGTDGLVYDLAVFDDGAGQDLYVGGCFDTAGGVTVDGIARWDGVEWSAVAGPSGSGVDGDCVVSLTVWDDGTGPALYVGGGFTSAGGVEARNIARWDGVVWSALEGPAGNGVDNAVWAMRGFNDGEGPALATVGYFSSAG